MALIDDLLKIEAALVASRPRNLTSDRLWKQHLAATDSVRAMVSTLRHGIATLQKEKCGTSKPKPSKASTPYCHTSILLFKIIE